MGKQKEVRDGIFGEDRPAEKRPENYVPPARHRAGEDIPPSDNEEDHDGQDELDSVTS